MIANLSSNNNAKIVTNSYSTRPLPGQTLDGCRQTLQIVGHRRRKNIWCDDIQSDERHHIVMCLKRASTPFHVGLEP